MSLSARRAWIEIAGSSAGCLSGTVALRKESVDRNTASPHILGLVQPVALRKESVDRNNGLWDSLFGNRTSLSARRAWIEITTSAHFFAPNPVALRKESVDRNFSIKHCMAVTDVALRKESVDRNCVYLFKFQALKTSLSARRAWIEIVNRAKIESNNGGSSPQGERG